MGCEGFSIVCVLVCVLLIVVYGVQVKMVEVFEFFNIEIVDVENFLNVK